MFSKSTKLPINDKLTTEVKAEPLSNGLVLLYEQSLYAKVSLYNPKTKTITNEIQLFIDCSYLSDPRVDWFLLIPSKSDVGILVKSKKTLMTISTLKNDSDKEYAVIDKQLVILSFSKDDLNKMQWVITFHDENNYFKAGKSFHLKCALEINDRANSIRQLANGLIACEFQNSIKLFQKETHGSVVQYREKGSVQLGFNEKFVEMPTGELLTYSTRDYKIWDTNKPKSNPEPIRFEIEGQTKVRDVFPLIDGVHLVLNIGGWTVEQPLLYNRETKTAEEIYVDGKYVKCLQNLPNGNQLFHVNPETEDAYVLAYSEVIQQYKKTVLSTLIQKILLIDELKPISGIVPKEVMRIIFLNLYDLLVKEQPTLVHFINELPELMAEEKQHNFCSL